MQYVSKKKKTWDSRTPKILGSVFFSFGCCCFLYVRPEGQAHDQKKIIRRLAMLCRQPKSVSVASVFLGSVVEQLSNLGQRRACKDCSSNPSLLRQTRQALCLMRLRQCSISNGRYPHSRKPLTSKSAMRKFCKKYIFLVLGEVQTKKNKAKRQDVRYNREENNKLQTKQEDRCGYMLGFCWRRSNCQSTS